MELKEKLIHSCTLNENVQDLLLEYIKDDDAEELEHLLEDERVDVNKIYKDTSDFRFEEKNALQIACAYFADETSEKCIQLLLDYGADIFYTDPNSGKNALNFAAESRNYKILETILNYIKKNELDVSNSDIIYSLIKYIRDSDMNEEEFVLILKLLLDTDIGININYQHIKSGWTTIYLAAKYKYKNFVQTMIDLRKSEINLDEFKDKKGKTARDLIIDQNLYNGVLPEYTEENSNVTIKTLYKNIRERSVEHFTENFNNIEHTLSEIEKYSLLNMAVTYRLDKVIKILLDNGVNYENTLNNEKNPMILAAQKGYYKIVKMFISTKPNAELVSQALFELLKTAYTTEQSENVNYNKCLTYLLKSKHLDINATDFNGNTALHYAVRYQDPEMALKILRKGATLASKDSFNRLAIADMDSLTLEAHLNDCIRYEYEEISTQEDACLIIDFTSLLPTENNKIHHGSQKIAVDVDSQTQLDITNTQYVPETEVLEYMCTSQELKQHLKHPVILTFLFLKWCRIAKFFYINLSLYILFVISLLSYITFGYNIKSESQHEVVTSVSYGILACTFIVLIIREISQLILNKHKYFLKFENWLEIVLLIATGGILSQHSNETLMRQFSAIAIVTAAIEFLLLVGQFPVMYTNIMMLRTVSYTFFKLLLWYSILLVAFSYSFYTLFQERGEEAAPTNSTDTGEEEEQDFFEDPGMSLLKTIVMLTGEFDAASIKFNNYPIISHLIFVMFVFLIAIVLFNLLNGLAVSDTQIIKNDAELYGQILRVEHIAHIEKVLLTNIISNRIMQYIPAIQKICLFPLYTEKAEALVYPNQNSKVTLITRHKPNTDTKPGDASCFKVFFGVYLDKKTQREISQLMKDKKEEKSKKKLEDKLFTEIAELRKMVQTLIKKQS